jgi:hypothetical protein
MNPATYKWSTTISGDAVTGSQTLSFTHCPLGVFGNDANLYIMVNSNAEIDRSTGTGTCVPGSKGNIKFTISGTYTNPTVGSSSSGIYEGIIDAEANGTGVSGTTAANWGVKLQPTSPPDSTYYAVYAPITVSNPIADIDGSGASIDVETPSFAFYFPAGGETTIHGFRVGTRTSMNGAAITKIECSSNVSTISTTLNPVVGTYIDIQYTDNTHFWGVHGPVVNSGPTSFTLTDNRCTWAATPGAGMIAGEPSIGGAAAAHAFILDNGQNLRVSDTYFSNAGWASGKLLNNGIIVWNDQSFHADNIAVLGAGFNCGENYCGQTIYAPGGGIGGGSMAAVGWLNGLNLSMQCAGNGINWLSGNSINVTDAVIQGQAQFAMQVGNMRGNYAGAASTNIYGETSAGCKNPFYTAAGLSGAAAASQAGIRALGNDLYIGPSPVGTSGLLPNFAKGGATTYTYYAVIHDGTKISSPLPFGIASPPKGSFRIGWPRYSSRTASIVRYDILKIANTASNQRGVPVLNGINQAIAVATDVVQCSALVCTLTDTGGPLLNYAPSNAVVGLDPFLWNWPGHIVLSHGGHLYSSAGVYGGPGGTVTTRPDYQTVFAPDCNQDSPNVYTSCLGTTANGGTLLPNTTNFGGGPANRKGRLIFSSAYSTIPVVGHIVTLWDSCPACTLADSFHRPANNPKDGYIGIDRAASLTDFGITFGAATSINQYIGNAGDGTSWKEHLDANAKTFAVPVKVPTGAVGSTSLNFNSGPGWFSPSSTCTAMSTSATERFRMCQNGFTFGSPGLLQWTASAASSGTVDTTLTRVSPGMLAVNSGTGAGSGGDMLASNYLIPITATSAIPAGSPVKASKASANRIAKTLHTDTGAGIVIGVSVNAPRAGATTQVATTGVVPMIFDTSGTGNCSIGDWVIVGTTTDGQVQCSSTYPAAGTVIGVALQPQSTSHTAFNVMVGLR